MLIIGLLLVVVSAAGAALLISYNHSGGPEQTIVMFGRDWLSVTPLEAFIAGLALSLVFCIGVWMIVGTERRRRAARSEYRAVRREARSATRERDRLARELADREERTEAERAEAARAEAETPPTGTRRPAWTAPKDDESVPRHGETTETQGPAEPRRRFGRHFRRSERTETETPASSGPAQ